MEFEAKGHLENAKSFTEFNDYKKVSVEARSEADRLLAFHRTCYKKMGYSVVRLSDSSWRKLYSSFYGDYVFDKLYYVDAVMYLYDDSDDDDNRCNMIIAATYKYPDSNSRYKLEIYAIDKYRKVEHIESIEVTEDERYISAVGNTYLIDHRLIHINDIMSIIEKISAVLPREAVPALFSITHEFVTRCCREIDWSHWNNKR